MNSLFNYELDEQQIRSTLANATLEFSEASWIEFDNAYPGHQAVATRVPKMNLPKVSLNINRNVLVPLFFIIGLGGVSAIMFRFIDFKANKPAEVEKALIPDASNFKPAATLENQPVKTEKHTAEKEVKKEAAPAVSEPIKTDVPAATQAQVAQTGNPPETKQEQPAEQKPQYATQRTNYPVQKPVTQPGQTLATTPAGTPDTSSGSSKPMANLGDQTPTNYNARPGRGRKKVITVDQVESIKAPSLTTQSQTEEQEPELIIKTE